MDGCTMAKKNNNFRKLGKKYLDYVDESNKRLERNARRQRSFDNRVKGTMGETRFVLTKKYWEGKHVQRTGKGHDFTVQTRDCYGIPRGPKIYHEIKNGPDARLSPLQREKQKELGGRYVVVHYGKRKKRR